MIFVVTQKTSLFDEICSLFPEDSDFRLLSHSAFVQELQSGAEHIMLHPILIDMKYKQEIQQLNPHIGLRELIRNHTEDIFEVEVGTDAILQDIDTPGDYQREKEKS